MDLESNKENSCNIEIGVLSVRRLGLLVNWMKVDFEDSQEWFDLFEIGVLTWIKLSNLFFLAGKWVVELVFAAPFIVYRSKILFFKINYILGSTLELTLTFLWLSILIIYFCKCKKSYWATDITLLISVFCH
jgi:hypothetical protein